MTSELINFLLNKGFYITLTENEGFIASFRNEVSLCMSPNNDGSFAAKAIDLSINEVLSRYISDTNASRLSSDRKIGWWAYESDIPMSKILHICNHDHSASEIKWAVNHMLE